MFGIRGFSSALMLFDEVSRSGGTVHSAELVKFVEKIGTRVCSAKQIVFPKIKFVSRFARICIIFTSLVIIRIRLYSVCIKGRVFVLIKTSVSYFLLASFNDWLVATAPR